MRSPSCRRANPSYRPHLFILENRLALGDSFLGVLTSLALLPAHAAHASAGEPSGAATVGRIGTSILRKRFTTSPVPGKLKV